VLEIRGGGTIVAATPAQPQEGDTARVSREKGGKKREKSRLLFIGKANSIEWVKFIGPPENQKVGGEAKAARQ